jgi:hypothetical protein
MKKILFSIIACIGIMINSSCSKSGGSSGGGSVCQWSCDIDGVHYSWTGTYPDSKYGQSVFASNTLALYLPQNVFAFNPFMLVVNFPTEPSSGTYTFNSSNSDISNVVILTMGTKSSDAVAYSTYLSGASMNVTVPSIPKNSVANAGLTGAGYFKGSFSGTLVSAAGKSISITNGQYEVIRVQ